MDTKKIEALKALGVSQELIDQLLEDVAMVEKSADEQHVRYKGAKMRNGLDVAAALTAALETVEDSVWAQYTRGADEKAVELSRALIARCKAAIDPTGEPDLADELAQAIAAAGRDTVRQALMALVSMAGNGRETLASSGEQSTATKAAQRDPYAQAVQAGPPRGWRPN